MHLSKVVVLTILEHLEGATKTVHLFAAWQTAAKNMYGKRKQAAWPYT